jgi:molecular chaperone GrpE
MSSPDDTSAGPVIRDRRRIDPDTGQVRNPDQPGAPGAAPGGSGSPPPAGGKVTGQRGSGKHAAPEPQDSGTATGAAETAAALTQLAERTADLQRLQAEYANYRKRVERDRAAVREQALANVLGEFLPALDDIGRAREHGELSGGFKSVADSLESAVAKLGLTSFGEKGDPFDPVVHEALMHSYSSDVSAPTCVQILQPGYKIGDRILRPARVAVAEPGNDDNDGTADGAPGETGVRGSEPPQRDAADGGG